MRHPFLIKFESAVSIFKSQRSGSAALIFGLAFVPMMLLVGSAIDIKRVATATSRMQAAADAAAIAISQQPSLTQSQRQALAQNSVLANLGQLTSQINPTIVETESSGIYNVKVSGSVPMMIMKIAGFNSVAVAKQSSASTKVSYSVTPSPYHPTAQYTVGAGRGCVLSLNNSSVADSFWDTGNATLTTGCDIIVNSVNPSAFDVNGSAQLVLASMIPGNAPTSCAQPCYYPTQVYIGMDSSGNAGGYTASTPSRVSATVNTSLGALYSPRTNPTPKCRDASNNPTFLCTKAPQMADPYANVQGYALFTTNLPQTTSSCNDSESFVEKYNYSTSKNDTLCPGLYHGGISIKSNAVVSLYPGTYVLDGGSLSVNGQATLQLQPNSATGSGVTFVYTKINASSYATASINGGATVVLSAPTRTWCNENGVSGWCFPGILHYLDPKAPVGTSFSFNGGANQTFVGALYLPTASLSLTGDNTSTTSLPTAAYSGCMQIIANMIKFSGNNNFGIADYSGCTPYYGTLFDPNNPTNEFMVPFGVTALATPSMAVQ